MFLLNPFSTVLIKDIENKDTKNNEITDIKPEHINSNIKNISNNPKSENKKTKIKNDYNKSSKIEEKNTKKLSVELKKYSNGSYVSGTIELYFTCSGVPKAQSMTLLINNQFKMWVLGSIGIYIWNTKTIDDGKYYLKLIVHTENKDYAFFWYIYVSNNITEEKVSNENVTTTKSDIKSAFLFIPPISSNTMQYISSNIDITIKNPANDSTVGGDVTIDANASSSVGTISEMRIYIDEELKKSVFDIDSITYLWSSYSNPDGNYNITIYAKDSDGGESTKTIFVQTNNHPDISFISPSNNETIIKGIYLIQGEAVCEDTISWFALRVDSLTVYNSSSSSISYNLDTVSYFDGRHTLELICKTIHSIETNLKYIVIIDNTKPVLFTDYPTNNTDIYGTITLTTSAFDVHFSKIQIIINGTTVYSNGNGSFTWKTINYEDAYYNVTTIASDTVGNSQKEYYLYKIDNVPNFHVKPEKIVIEGSQNFNITINCANELKFISLYFNGLLYYQTTSYNFSYLLDSLDFLDGNLTVLVKAIDTENVEYYYYTWVIVDNDPEITIDNDINNTYVHGILSLNCFSSSNHVTNISAILDNTEIAFNDSNYLSISIDTKTLATTNHNLTIVINGLYGQNSTYINFYVNNNPTIDSFIPLTGTKVFNEVSIEASITFENNPGIIIFYINGTVVYSISGSSSATYTWNTESYTDGTYNISVYCKDEFGFSNFTSNLIYLENTPEISFLDCTPANSTEIHATVFVAGYVTSIFDIDYVQLWFNNSLINSTNSKNFNFSINTLNYKDGQKNLTIIVKTLNSTTNYVYMQYYINNVPEIFLDSFNDGSKVGGNFLLKLHVESFFSDLILSLYINNELREQISNYQITYNWNTEELSDGNANITIYAECTGGNNISIAIVEIDNIPDIEIISPVSFNEKFIDNVLFDFIGSGYFNISNVSLFFDNNLIHSVTDTQYFTYNLDTTKYADNSYPITIYIQDTQNHENYYYYTMTINNYPNINLSPTTTINGSHVAGLMDINGTIDTQRSLKNTTIYIDNIVQATYTGTSFSFEWNTLLFEDNKHIITIKSYDSEGYNNQTTLVYVVDNLPSIWITSPANNSMITNTEKINITVDSFPILDSIKVYLNSTLIETISSNSSGITYFSVSLDSTLFADGYYILKVEAITQITTTNSTKIQINIDNFPNINIISPVENEEVYDLYPINVQISGPPIKNSTIAIDGKIVSIFYQTTGYIYYWNTSLYADGYHEIIVTTISEFDFISSENVNVFSNNVPNLILSSSFPEEEQVYAGTIELECDAYSTTSITNFSLYIDNILVNSTNTNRLTYSWNTLSYSNEYHTIYYHIVNSKSFSNQTSKRIRIANNPQFHTYSPSNNTMVYGTIFLNTTITCGNAYSYSQIYIDTNLLTTTSNSSIYYPINTWNYDDGFHKIKIIAYDSLDNSNSTLFQLTFSNVANITTSLTDEEIIYNDYLLNISIDSNPEISSLKVYLNETVIYSGTSKSISLPIDTFSWSEGKYNFTVLVLNEFGQNFTDKRWIYIKNYPELQSINIVSNQKFNENYTITFDVFSAQGIQVSELYINGSLKYSNSGTSNSFIWQTRNYEDGIYNITICIKDIENDQTIYQYIVKVINHPHIIFNQKLPLNNSIVTETIVFDISIDAYPYIDQAAIYINGTIRTLTNSDQFIYKWNTKLVQDNLYNVTIFVEDASGDRKILTYFYTVDNIPQLDCEVPPEGLLLEPVYLNVTGSGGNNISKIEVYENDILVGVAYSNEYSYLFNTLVKNDGFYTILFKIIDEMGNTNSSAFSYLVDNLASINISPDITTEIFGNLTLSITIESQREFNSEIYINGTVIYSNNSSSYEYLWETFDYEDGLYNITVLVIDIKSFKNSTTQFYRVNNNPDIQFINITNNAVVFDTITIEVNTSSYYSITSNKLLINSSEVFQTNNSNFEYDLNTLDYEEGVIIVQVISTNNQSRVSSSEITLIIDNFPKITLTPSNNSIVYADTIITSEISSYVSIINQSLYIDGNLITTSTTTILSYNWNTTLYADGLNNITIVAFNSNERKTTLTYFYSVNNVPDLTVNVITTPANNSIIFDTITLAFEITTFNELDNVQIIINDTVVLYQASTTIQYNWNTIDYLDGTYNVTFYVINTFGFWNKTTLVYQVFNIPEVTYTINDNNGFLVNDINMQVNSSVGPGINNIKIKINGSLLYQNFSDSINFTYDSHNFKDGNYLITIDVESNSQITTSVFNYYTIKNLPEGSFVTPTPANHSTVFGTINTINVTSSSLTGIDNITLLINSIQRNISFSDNLEYNWDTTLESDGLYNITVVITDQEGDNFVLHIEIEIKNNPFTALTNLYNMSVVFHDVKLEIRGESLSSLKKHQLYINGSLVNSTTSLNLSYLWNTEIYSDNCYNITILIENIYGFQNSVTYYLFVRNVPQITLHSPLNYQTITGENNITITISMPSGSNFTQLFLNGTLILQTSSTEINYLWDTLLYNDGIYNLTVYSETIYNFNSTKQYIFTVDNIPQLTIITPSEGSILYGSVIVTAEATGGNNISKIELYVDEELYVSENSSSFNQTISSWIFDDGMYLLTFRVIDVEGNYNDSAKISVTINNIPNIDFVYPTPPEKSIIYGYIEINISVTDINNPIHNTTLLINDQIKAVVNDSILYYLFNSSIYNDGVCTIKAIVYNNYGYINYTTHILQIDNIPNIQIEGISNNEEIIDIKTITIQTTSGSNITNTSIYINSILQASNNNNNLVFDFNTLLYSDGNYSITVTTENEDGFYNSTTLFVIINNIPNYSYSGPQYNEKITNSKELYISGYSPRGVDFILLELVSQENHFILANYSSDTLSYTLNTLLYPDDNYNLTLTVKDNGGFLNSTAIPIIIDNIPQIHLDQGMLNLNNSIVIDVISLNCTATGGNDISHIKLQIDDEIYLISNNSTLSYLWDTILETDGNYKIELTVTDTYSNENKTILYLTIDNYPDLYIDSKPSESSLIGNNSFIYHATTQRTIAFMEVWIDSQLVKNISASSDTFIWETELYQDNIYSIYFKVYDSAGFTNYSNIYIYKITNIPDINFSHFEDLSKDRLIDTINATVTISEGWTIQEIRIFIDNVLKVYSQPGERNLIYYWNTLNYSDGIHEFNVTVIDEQDHYNSTVLSCNIDNYPQIDDYSPEYVYVRNSVVLTASGSGGRTIDNITLLINNSIVHVTNSPIFSYVWETNDSYYSNGVYEIKYLIYDVEGYMNTTIIYYIVDNEEPIITITNLCDYQGVTSTFELMIRSQDEIGTKTMYYEIYFGLELLLREEFIGNETVISEWTITVKLENASLEDEILWLQVTVIDLSGNQNSTCIYLVYNDIPDIQIYNVNEDDVLFSSSYYIKLGIFSGISSANVEVQLYDINTDNYTKIVTFVIDDANGPLYANESFNLDTRVFDDGLYYLRIVVFPSGNSAIGIKRIAVEIDNHPNILVDKKENSELAGNSEFNIIISTKNPANIFVVDYFKIYINEKSSDNLLYKEVRNDVSKSYFEFYFLFNTTAYNDGVITLIFEFYDAINEYYNLTTFSCYIHNNPEIILPNILENQLIGFNYSIYIDTNYYGDFQSGSIYINDNLVSSFDTSSFIWLWQTENYKDGNYTLKITVSTLINNTYYFITEKEVNVIIQNYPSWTFSSTPLNGSIIFNTIELKFTFINGTPINNFYIYVDNFPALIINMSAYKGSATIEFNTKTINDGWHTLLLLLETSYNYIINKTLTVLFDNKPNIYYVSDNIKENGFYNNEIDISFKANSTTSVFRLGIDVVDDITNISISDFPIEINNNETFSTIINTTKYTTGNYQILIYAIDNEYDMIIIKYKVTFDNDIPEIYSNNGLSLYSNVSEKIVFTSRTAYISFTTEDFSPIETITIYANKEQQIVHKDFNDPRTVNFGYYHYITMDGETKIIKVIITDKAGNIREAEYKIQFMLKPFINEVSFGVDVNTTITNVVFNINISIHDDRGLSSVYVLLIGEERNYTITTEFENLPLNKTDIKETILFSDTIIRKLNNKKLKDGNYTFVIEVVDIDGYRTSYKQPLSIERINRKSFITIMLWIGLSTLAIGLAGFVMYKKNFPAALWDRIRYEW
ncbi:MAG: hypothetical protein K9W46_04485 [Candidatus Heimdallarchaeum endolithica]|uniref:Ig-like domain-containing protein n=1 Tax=Candidatus Heimdallarchaeum endolithica TaxID=2876572 RepID=A0A9Y1FPU0_9ARCH|nr:MAG: hypothetical protein K9W46_04485 [Candidatus Heimdallarchaeum endolithica]